MTSPLELARFYVATIKQPYVEDEEDQLAVSRLVIEQHAEIERLTKQCARLESALDEMYTHIRGAARIADEQWDYVTRGE